MSLKKTPVDKTIDSLQKHTVMVPNETFYVEPSLTWDTRYALYLNKDLSIFKTILITTLTMTFWYTEIRDSVPN